MIPKNHIFNQSKQLEICVGQNVSGQVQTTRYGDLTYEFEPIY